jgi:radical SAM superfamily enzyme YgiQ (UPF0313 family)
MKSRLALLRARRPGPLRVLLVQLPIQELVFRRVRGNELVAPGYLKASLERALGARVEVEVLARPLVDRLGDAALAREVAARCPDLVGFSLFLWNSARSLALAAKVSELLPEAAVVVGGPEVTRDNPWCVAAPGVDVGVVGEGEETLVELARWCTGEGPAELERIPGLALPARSRRTLPLAGEDLVHATPARPALDLASLPSPYLTGAIALDGDDRGAAPRIFDRTLSVETLRGCPFKCSFCYYYKQFAKTNAFPRGWLAAHFEHAREHGARELFFLDPTLNARPHFSEFLDEVIALNERAGFELHAELVADMVDDKIADKLERAGFKGVECGLQSANPTALAAVNRMCDLERFAAGVTRMDRRGIVVKTDLIIGLPQDDEASARRSIEWVRTRKLDADVQVFHLMVLPGTELREKSDELGYERLRRPPYYATRSRWMDEAAMRRLIEHAGDVFELEFDAPDRALAGAALARGDPRGTGGAGGPPGGDYWTRATVDAGTSSEEARAAAESAANALTVTVRDVASGVRFLEEVARANPFATFDVLVATAAPTIGELQALKTAAATPDAYLNGYHRFQVPPGALVSTRVSVVARSARPDLEPIVPLIYEKTVESWRDVGDHVARHEGQALLLRRGERFEASADELVARLLPRFEEDADAVYFADREAALLWEERARRKAPEDAPPERELARDLAPERLAAKA